MTWINIALCTLALASNSGQGPAPVDPVVPTAQDEDPDKLIDALFDEFNEQSRLFREALRKTADDDKDKGARKLAPDMSALSQALMDVADGHPGTDAAARALGFVSSRGHKDHRDAAMERLIKDHPDSDEVLGVLSRVRESATLEGLLENSKNESVRGVACYFMAQLMEDEDSERFLALLGRCEGEFAEIVYHRRTLKERAEGDRFEFENLQIGMIAPDIEGEDVDGVAFKLSDYRGQVVVVDFWGHW